jgi:DNA-binding NarL/FixJ family response regulator
MDNAEEQSPLTKREIEVLSLLTQGYSNVEVGKTLNIAYATVQSHRVHIGLTLNLHDLASLVKYAIKHGFTTLDS